MPPARLRFGIEPPLPGPLQERPRSPSAGGKTLAISGIGRPLVRHYFATRERRGDVPLRPQGRRQWRSSGAALVSNSIARRPKRNGSANKRPPLLRYWFATGSMSAAGLWPS
jgi:hypothetical protein